MAGALLILTHATHAIAVDTAKFSAPEIHRGCGLLWSWLGCSESCLKELGLNFIMRGQSIDANKAEIWGLINESVAANELG